MKKILIGSTVLGIMIFAACSQKVTPTTTTPVEPPKPMATTFMGEVQPLIQAKCTPCHLPSKGGFKANFETYESAKKYGPDMIVRIEKMPTDKGFMPFKHDKLTVDEIDVFKKWVADGMMEK